jgi:hypothetical protein
MKKYTNTTLINIEMSEEKYKLEYSLRGRIGIFILRLLGVVTLQLTKKDERKTNN